MVFTKEVSGRRDTPYQIGKEFHKERLGVIKQQGKIYNETSTKIKELDSTFNNLNRNPFLNNKLLKRLSDILDEVQGELNLKNQLFEDLILKDTILDNISLLFENKIGTEFSEEQLSKIFKLGQDRYNKKTPPGYQDKSKSEPEKYGDFIIWNQIIDYSKEHKKSIIFVTDDRKEDWWLIDSGKIIGPRPELRKEFYEKANNEFYIYQPFNFLEIAQKQFEVLLKEETINEVKDLKPISKNPENQSIKGEILITLTVENNKESNISGFIDLLNSNGYETYKEVISPNQMKLFIPVPPIPDLTRRIKDRFVTKIDEFGLKLLDFKPNDE